MGLSPSSAHEWVAVVLFAIASEFVETHLESLAPFGALQKHIDDGECGRDEQRPYEHRMDRPDDNCAELRGRRPTRDRRKRIARGGHDRTCDGGRNDERFRATDRGIA